MTREQLQARVERGAALLDVRYPTWREELREKGKQCDLTGVSMTWGEPFKVLSDVVDPGCVLCRLYGTYDNGLTALDLAIGEVAASYGFTYIGPEDDGALAVWSTIAELWREQYEVKA